MAATGTDTRNQPPLASLQGKRQKEKGKRKTEEYFCPLPFALCLPRRGCLTGERSSTENRRSNSTKNFHGQHPQKQKHNAPTRAAASACQGQDGQIKKCVATT